MRYNNALLAFLVFKPIRIQNFRKREVRHFTPYCRRGLNKFWLTYDWITNSLEKKNVIRCFNDIKFNPIHFSTLSNILEKFIYGKNLTGIYNAGSIDGLSKYNFAKKIAEHKNLNLNLIKKIDSDKYFEIKRPKDMRMNVSKIQRTLKIKMPSIKEEIYKLN